MKKLRMKTNDKDGNLIVFCGLDGCGKTTMINRLATALESIDKIHLTKQPTDAVRKSDIFRTYMDCPNHSRFDYRSLSLLAASDRIQHTNKEIADALSRGETVICDRYFYSCLANLRARGYTKDSWIYEVSESIIKPDLSFFLDLPVSEAVRRVRSRPEEKDRYIDLTLQYKLRREYLDICKRNKGILIDSSLPEDICFGIILDSVNKLQKGK